MPEHNRFCAGQPHESPCRKPSGALAKLSRIKHPVGGAMVNMGPMKKLDASNISSAQSTR
jgi:hypothetical protein